MNKLEKTRDWFEATKIGAFFVMVLCMIFWVITQFIINSGPEWMNIPEHIALADRLYITIYVLFGISLTSAFGELVLYEVGDFLVKPDDNKYTKK